MRLLLMGLVLLGAQGAWAEKPGMKTQTFMDRVYKIKEHQKKSLITFYREPVLYEVVDQDKKILKKLEDSQKNQKAVVVIVDPLTRKILEVKGP